MFTDFHTWLFAFDDEYCDEESSSMSLADWIPFLSRLQRHVEAGPLDTLVSHPYAESLRDIAERLTPWCTPAQKARWFTALRMYFQALVWEAHSRSQGSGPAAGQSRTDEYILMRLDNGAMQSSIALLDMACGYELPTPERERPDVRAIVEMTAVLVSWDNDIFSWHKEHQRGTASQWNLLDVLAPCDEAGHEAALRYAVRLRNGVMRLFVQLTDQIAPSASEPLRMFLTSLGHWVRANLDFSRTTSRYADPDRTLTSSTWRSTVTEQWVADPLRFESLSWWGSVLAPAKS